MDTYLAYVALLWIRIIAAQTSEYLNAHIPGENLVRDSWATSRSGCHRLCSNSRWCFGYDYDVIRGRCWRHGYSTACKSIAYHPTTIHVKLHPCGFNKSYLKAKRRTHSYDYMDNRHIIGGILQPYRTSSLKCADACATSRGCYAADYNSHEASCWHHRDVTSCGEVPQRMAGVSHYRMNTCTRTRETTALQILDNPSESSRSSKSIFSSKHTCGRPKISHHGSRIIGGDEARAHSFPWQVALRNRKARSSRCAGSIVAPQWVLTTAHCVDQDVKASHWLALSGSHDLLQLEPRRKAHRVEQIILHSDFDLTTFDSDVALLKLSKPVAWDHVRTPVCLPPAGYRIPAGTRCITAGWGIAVNGRRPLKQVTVPVLSRDTCRRPDWLGSEFTITDHMICAGYEQGGTDTCQGDSGGPLVCFLDNHWVQVGVTSFGRGCGLPKKPGVYAEVANFVEWIQEITATF